MIDKKSEWQTMLEQNRLLLVKMQDLINVNKELNELIKNLVDFSISGKIQASLVVPNSVSSSDALSFVNSFTPLSAFINSKAVYNNPNYDQYNFFIDKDNFKRIQENIFVRGLDYLLVDYGSITRNAFLIV